LRAVFHELRTGEDATGIDQQTLHDTYSIRNNRTDSEWSVCGETLRNDPTYASYYRFTVVRPPWERLASWYRDKILGKHSTGGDASFSMVGMAKVLESVYLDWWSSPKTGSSFEEILVEVLSLRGCRAIQHHIAPIYIPEGVPYDEVIELKDLSTRLSSLLEERGCSPPPSAKARRNAIKTRKVDPSLYYGSAAPSSPALAGEGVPPWHNFYSSLGLSVCLNAYWDELNRISYRSSVPESVVKRSGVRLRGPNLVAFPQNLRLDPASLKRLSSSVQSDTVDDLLIDRADGRPGPGETVLNTGT
jgi:hypothetical protein